MVYDIVLTTWDIQWNLMAFNRDVMGFYRGLITNPLRVGIVDWICQRENGGFKDQRIISEVVLLL